MLLLCRERCARTCGSVRGFTCDGKARDVVKAGKDRDLSALDAPAEPAGTAEGPSFTARALSWVLSLLCAAVACVWPPLAVPERPGACPAARSATTLRGNDLEAQLSSAGLIGLEPLV